MWCLTFLGFCLRNFMFVVGSQKFVWEDGEAIVEIHPL